MADLKAFAEQLVNLTVKEVNELATILKAAIPPIPAIHNIEITTIQQLRILTYTIIVHCVSVCWNLVKTT